MGGCRRTRGRRPRAVPFAVSSPALLAHTRDVTKLRANERISSLYVLDDRV